MTCDKKEKINQQREKARNLRYKRGTLARFGWEYIRNTLTDIEEACSDIRWYFDDDGDNILAALDGDEEEVYEFRMAYADLESCADALEEQIGEVSRYEEDFGQRFDDCTVALLGNRFRVLGYDTYEEDYYSLCSFESDIAVSESGKRLQRLTKSEMIAKIGQCFGIAIAFFDLERKYDYLSATMDILRGENQSILQTVKNIEKAYERAVSTEKSYGDEKEFERLVKELPDRCWIE